MSATLEGGLNWNLRRDDNGHRTYEIEWLLRVDEFTDGPRTVLNCPDLPQVGDPWSFGGDSDPWAFCTPRFQADPVVTNEPGLWWRARQTFSTRPMKRCNDSAIENPLDEPPRISGSYIKFTKQATKDRFGNRLENSAKQQYKGPIVEFDDNRPTVRIQLTVLTLPLATMTAAVDTVNDANLWGLGPRKIKLCNASWERFLYGVCTFYYVITYEFEINFFTFDRVLVDSGTRHLIEGGSLDDPRDFVVYKDLNGEKDYVELDGAGKVLGAGLPLVERTLEYYDETNLLDLGIPTSL